MGKTNSKTKPFGKKRRGFMLLELIICIAIIGILAAVAVPDLLGMTDEAKVARIKADLSTIGTAAEMYNVRNGKYPSTPADLVSTEQGKGYLKKVPDPPDKSVTYKIDTKTGEVTADYKGVTYSSFGNSTGTATGTPQS